MAIVKTKSENPKRPLESTEQIALVMKFSLFHPLEAKLLFAIPNGGYRNPREAIRLKREGVRAGVPDLMLAIPKDPYHGLFIEMKRTDGGVISPAQKNMHALLQTYGYRVEVCNGADAAYAILTKYINL